MSRLEGKGNQRIERGSGRRVGAVEPQSDRGSGSDDRGADGKKLNAAAAESGSVAVTLDAEQFVRRVLVETAKEGGQSIADVARQSFALTLWMWSELRLIHREAQVERMGERTDLAGQVAIAFHQPQDLQKMEMRYLKAAGQLSKMFDTSKDRLAQLAQQAARAQFQTTEA